MKELLKKVLKAIAIVVVVTPIVLGAVNTIVVEKEAFDLVKTIENTITSNIENAVSISESKYYDDMEFNRYHVQDEVRDSNVAPMFTIEHTSKDGNEFTNEVYLTEFDGQYGLLIIQDAELNATDWDKGVIQINYMNDIHKLAEYTAYYGYGCVEAI